MPKRTVPSPSIQSFWHQDDQSGVFQTSDHRVSFGTRSRKVDINVGRCEDRRFQGHIVLQVFCEFGLNDLSLGGETEG
jgi:hypothetical protein